jgi:hypothetical protein
MLAILDPVLFDPAAPLTIGSLKGLLRLLHSKQAHIPDVAWYWKKVQRELIRPLHARPEYRELDRLYDFVQAVKLPTMPSKVKVCNFDQMFGLLGAHWVVIMENLVTQAVLTGEEIVLLTHLRSKRNLTVHQGPGRCTAREKMYWELRVQPAGDDTTRVPVVCRKRNLDVPWTCRFDDSLPAEFDDAKYPFCPPRDWRDPKVAAVTTHKSRPTWRDQKGNYWARPATGEGYHWDVYLTRSLEEEYGLGQLNIVQWGVPPKEGPTGGLHHVPEGKKSRLKKESGWRC